MLQLGLGWDLSQQTEIPLAFQVRPFLLAQIPSNTFVLPRWGVEGVAILPMERVP